MTLYLDKINPESFPTYTKWLCGVDYDFYTINVASVPYNLTLDFEFNPALKIRFALLDSAGTDLAHTRDNFLSYLIETAGNYTLMVIFARKSFFLTVSDKSNQRMVRKLHDRRKCTNHYYLFHFHY